MFLCNPADSGNFDHVGLTYRIAVHDFGLWNRNDYQLVTDAGCFNHLSFSFSYSGYGHATRSTYNIEQSLKPRRGEPGYAGGFFLFKGRFSFPLLPSDCLQGDCWGFHSNIYGLLL